MEAIHHEGLTESRVQDTLPKHRKDKKNERNVR